MDHPLPAQLLGLQASVITRVGCCCLLLLHLFILCVCERAHACAVGVWSLKTSCRNCFSLSTMWGCGIKHQAREQESFRAGPSHQPSPEQCELLRAQSLWDWPTHWPTHRIMEHSREPTSPNGLTLWWPGLTCSLAGAYIGGATITPLPPWQSRSVVLIVAACGNHSENSAILCCCSCPRDHDLTGHG